MNLKTYINIEDIEKIFKRRIDPELHFSDLLDWIENFFNTESFENEKKIYIEENVIIQKGVHLEKNSYIMKNTILKSGAYIGENVIIGENCVIGHGTEVYNSIIQSNTNLAHFNHIGHSIIGENVNLAAGVIISNYKNFPFGGEINSFDYKDNKISTSKVLLGALIGSGSKIGCSSVIYPGTIIGKNVVTYPMVSLRGFIEANFLYKRTEEYERIK